MPLAPAQDAAEQVRVVLLKLVVEKTGYPEDMLDLDLDLEADLGIDTVKQVDVFARTRDHFGITRDPKASLRDYNTLRKVIEHLAPQVRAAPVAAPEDAAPPAAVAAPAALLAQAAEAGAGGASLNGNGAHPPGSVVRGALLAMDLSSELGLTDAEKRKLSASLAQRLGIEVPAGAPGARSLDELIALMSGGRRS